VIPPSFDLEPARISLDMPPVPDWRAEAFDLMDRLQTFLLVSEQPKAVRNSVAARTLYVEHEDQLDDVATFVTGCYASGVISLDGESLHPDALKRLRCRRRDPKNAVLAHGSHYNTFI
jgi:hypothetical protein